MEKAKIEIGKGARKARKKVDLKVVVSASLGDCSNIFEKLFIGVRACGFAKGVEAKGPVEAGVDWARLEEIAHAFVGINDEFGSGRIKWFSFIRASKGTEVRFLEFFLGIEAYAVKPNIVGGSSGVEEVCARGVCHVHVMVVQSGLELFWNSSCWDVFRRLIFIGVLFEDSFGRR